MPTPTRSLPTTTPAREAASSRAASSWRVAALTVAALLGFASNSLLTRLAIGSQAIDAATFTLIRIVSGAITLVVLVRWLPDGRLGGSAARPLDDWTAGRLRRRGLGGTWVSGAALAAYAVMFSLAYVRIGASAGALLLFGSVQATMIGWGLARGERPRRLDWAGLALALGGLILLTRPGLSRPDLLGSLMMIVAGIAWGVYSLRGRSTRWPLGATADNFVRAVPLVLVAILPLVSLMHATARGAVLAAISGSLTSAIAYTFWYAALPSLSAWRAALVQLAVPLVTAFGAVAFLDETINSRLTMAGALIAAGVVLSVLVGQPTSRDE